MSTGKRLKSQTKKVVVKSTGVNGLKDLLNEQLMPQEFQVPASRGYVKRKLTLVELLFQFSVFLLCEKVFFRTMVTI